MAAEEVFIGVDGGGSRCRVRVADARGRTIGAAEGGAANVHLDFDRALATIEATVAAACGPEAADHPHSIALGLAGAASPAVAARVASRLERPGRRVMVSNDALIACLGAHAGRDGGLVIAGTGSGAVLRFGNRIEHFGGRGFLLGDDGSGAVLGRAAWRRALRARDGLEAWTPLLRDLMSGFDNDPLAVVAWSRTASSREFATFAPLVIEAARADDPAGRALAAEAGASISELILALAARNAPRIALAGGLAAPLRPFLSEAARARLSPALRDALDGALLQAGAPLLPPRVDSHGTPP